MSLRFIASTTRDIFRTREQTLRLTTKLKFRENTEHEYKLWSLQSLSTSKCKCQLSCKCTSQLSCTAIVFSGFRRCLKWHVGCSVFDIYCSSWILRKHFNQNRQNVSWYCNSCLNRWSQHLYLILEAGARSLIDQSSKNHTNWGDSASFE